jgi:hypothetical protein
MRQSKYNFSDEKPKSSIEEEVVEGRKNFRLAQSCATCMHFRVSSKNGRRGHCLLTREDLHEEYKRITRKSRLAHEAAFMLFEQHNLPRVHISTLCDDFTPQPRTENFRAIENYTGVVISFKGEIRKDLTEEKQEQLRRLLEDEDDDFLFNATLD